MKTKNHIREKITLALIIFAAVISFAVIYLGIFLPYDSVGRQPRPLRNYLPDFSNQHSFKQKRALAKMTAEVMRLVNEDGSDSRNMTNFGFAPWRADSVENSEQAGLPSSTDASVNVVNLQTQSAKE